MDKNTWKHFTQRQQLSLAALVVAGAEVINIQTRLFTSSVRSLDVLNNFKWYDNPANIWNFIIDYDTRKQHDVHKALINGPTPPILLDVQSNETVYVIHPNTNDRNKVYYAPYTTVTFFWGIEEDKWTDVAPEFFAAVAKSDGCTGYIWGEVDTPILADFDGNASLGSGKCGILITGWRSKAQHDDDNKSPRVAEAWKAVQKVCAKADDWGTTLRITENTGHIHRWTTPLPLKDRSNWLPAAGMI